MGKWRRPQAGDGGVRRASGGCAAAPSTTLRVVPLPIPLRKTGRSYLASTSLAALANSVGKPAASISVTGHHSPPSICSHRSPA